MTVVKHNHYRFKIENVITPKLMKKRIMAAQEKVANTHISARKINWKEFACGWGAAFINITVTYPVNKLIFRQVFTKKLHYIQLLFYCLILDAAWC